MREDTSPDFKKIVKVADSATGPDESVGRNIFAKIDLLTGKKKSRLNPLLLLQYTPALKALLVVVLLAPIAVFVAFRTGLPAYVTDYPITLASNTGAYGEDGAAKKAGEPLGLNDRITAGEDSCVVEIAGSATISVLPGSRATVSGYGRFADSIEVSIEEGALYLHKKKDLAYGKKLTVRADDYTFLAEGTRALFEKTGDSISAACFDGRLAVARTTGRESIDIVSIGSGEKIKISLSGAAGQGTNSYYVGSPDEEETAVDQALHANPESNLRVRGMSSTKSTADAESSQTGKNNVSRTEGTETERASDEFTKVEEIGRLGFTPDGSNIRLFFPIVSQGTLYFLSSERLYRFSSGRLEEPIRFPEKPFFTSMPVIAKGVMILAETRKIHVIDTVNRRIVKTILLAANEAIEDGYSPQAIGNRIWIPVKNRGYCSIDLGDASYALTDAYGEPFPVSPIGFSQEGDVVVGSFYLNYIALLRGGAERWKLALTGKSFSNVAVYGGKIYSYLFDSVPKIVEISGAGSVARDWELDAEVTSDIAAVDGYVVGAYTDGTLFVLDTASAAVAKPVRMFSTRLSTRSLRYVSVLVSGGKVYAGTDRGEIVVYDLANRKIDQAIAVKKGEAFYAKPIIFEGSLYAISNEGILYRISKSRT